MGLKQVLHKPWLLALLIDFIHKFSQRQNHCRITLRIMTFNSISQICLSYQLYLICSRKVSNGYSIISKTFIEKILSKLFANFKFSDFEKPSN